MSSQNQQTSADPKRMRTLFLSRLLRAQTPGRSSEIRHRNKLTVKAWEKAVQELGNVRALHYTLLYPRFVSLVCIWKIR